MDILHRSPFYFRACAHFVIQDFFLRCYFRTISSFGVSLKCYPRTYLLLVPSVVAYISFKHLLIKSKITTS